MMGSMFICLFDSPQVKSSCFMMHYAIKENPISQLREFREDNYCRWSTVDGR
jgi:hypothetical protein